MQIRRLELKEHGLTRQLYEEVFTEDSTSFVDYYYSEKTKDNRIYVVEEDGGIQAMLHLNPYIVRVNKTENKLHYIVAVATRENFRGRGYMRDLLRKSLRDMYEAHECFTFLMPAAEAIYAPYDFCTVYEQERRCYPGSFEEVKGAEILGEKDCRELAGMAETYLGAHYQVYVKREADYYRRLLKEYASENEKILIFRENGKITDCKFPAPSQADLLKPKIMVRIVDLKKLLQTMRVRADLSVCFTVTDPLIRENDQCFLLTGTKDRGISVATEDRKNSEGTITIAALTCLLFGAKETGQIEADENVVLTGRLKTELEKIEPLTKIFLNEVV